MDLSRFFLCWGVISIAWYHLVLSLSIVGISSLFEYILRGSYGVDFCSMPETPARLAYEALEYEATPYEVCGPTCEEEGRYTCILTTRSLEDLTLGESMTREELATRFSKHSSAIVPNVLREETATELRRLVFEKSESGRAEGKDTELFVDSPENRWKQMVRFEDAIVRKALREIGEHPVFRPLLDEVIGPDSSLTQFLVIRGDYGSTPQVFHSDSGLIKTPYGYETPFTMDQIKIGIALQDTTEGMGETNICPGVQPSNGGDLGEGSDRMDNEDGSCTCWHKLPNGTWDSGDISDMCIGATMNAGDGLVFKNDVAHRGGAHTDPDAPSRLQVFLTFAAKRGDDERLLAGSPKMQVTYAVDPYFWGIGISTFKWLDMPFGLWRLSQVAIVARAYFLRIGAARKWWISSGTVPLTYLDALCLVRFKEVRCECFPSGNDGSGFYLENLEALASEFAESGRDMITRRWAWMIAWVGAALALPCALIISRVTRAGWRGGAPSNLKQD